MPTSIPPLIDGVKNRLKYCEEETQYFLYVLESMAVGLCVPAVSVPYQKVAIDSKQYRTYRKY